MPQEERPYLTFPQAEQRFATLIYAVGQGMPDEQLKPLAGELLAALPPKRALFLLAGF